jgi:hypothetical protein
VHAVVIYVVALALTLAIETPLYSLGHAVGFGGAAGDWRSGGTTGVRVNLVSHPIAFLIACPILVPLVGALAALVAVEVGVVYLEAVLVWRRRHSDPLGALALSCVANLSSLAIGLALLR